MVIWLEEASYSAERTNTPIGCHANAFRYFGGYPEEILYDNMKHPDQEEALEKTYDELESELIWRVEGLKHQIQLTTDNRNTIIQVNRAAKAAMDVFDDILNKGYLKRNDLELILDGIKVFEDHIEIQLKADLDALIRNGPFCLRFRMIKLLENDKTETGSSPLLVQGGYDHKYGQRKQNQADWTG